MSYREPTKPIGSHGSSFNNYLPIVMFLYRDERRPLNFRLSLETLSSDRVHLVKNALVGYNSSENQQQQWQDFPFSFLVHWQTGYIHVICWYVFSHFNPSSNSKNRWALNSRCQCQWFDRSFASRSYPSFLQPSLKSRLGPHSLVIKTPYKFSFQHYCLEICS